MAFVSAFASRVFVLPRIYIFIMYCFSASELVNLNGKITHTGFVKTENDLFIKQSSFTNYTV